MTTQPPRWECRWPDPVALQVASERILRGRPTTDPQLNRRLPIRVQMEPVDHPTAPTRALLVTPWAVERVYWHNPTQPTPPLRYIGQLTSDEEGRVAAGIGVILEYLDQRIPVLTAWEPEVGHHFVEILPVSVLGVNSVEEAVAVALGRQPATPPKRSVTDHLNLTVSRRNLFGVFRK
ncbi:MAG: hypothetical protein H7838_10760 [Magnetococcus sp. DMHC-8]